MQVSIEEVSSVKTVLHIEIPEKDVTKEVNKTYKDINKSSNIKGFRPGKVPRNVLERRFKKDVNADLIQKFVQDSVGKALSENNFENLFGLPKIDPPELEYDKPYKFDAVLEFFPVLNDMKYKGLELKKNIYKATEQEVDTQIKAIQQSQSKVVKIDEDRPAQADDYILIDYEGFKDGQPSEDIQKTENFTMKIGTSLISKELDENITGMKPGETKEILVTFPQDYKNQKLANQSIMFKISLKEIRKEILPEINDDFAKTLGPFENLDALKNVITANLAQGYAKRTAQELNEQIFIALSENQDFEVPESMIEAELAATISEFERSLSYNNRTMEELNLTPESLREEYRDVAIDKVKRHFLLDKIINDENLEVSEEEIEKSVEEMAVSLGKPVEELKEFNEKNPQQLQNLERVLLEQKAINLIIENSNIEEIEMELEQETEDQENKENQ